MRIAAYTDGGLAENVAKIDHHVRALRAPYYYIEARGEHVVPLAACN